MVFASEIMKTALEEIEKKKHLNAKVWKQPLRLLHNWSSQTTVHAAQECAEAEIQFVSMKIHRRKFYANLLYYTSDAIRAERLICAVGITKATRNYAEIRYLFD